jgi:two-component system, sensor histidine kinase ChiS
MQLRILDVSFGLAFASLSVLIGCSQNIPPKNQPHAIKGVLDLSHWDFEKDGPVQLSGEYEFYWRQFMRAENFVETSLPGLRGCKKINFTII